MHAVTRHAWLITFLVFVFMLINFADKAVLGLASKPIMHDLGLSHEQFGVLGSAFFALFSISGVLVGFLAGRVRAKTIMFTMAVVWAAAVLPLVGVATFGFLLATRVVLGAAEGPAFPMSMHTVYKWFPDGKRAVPSSVVACGAAFGTGVVAPGVAWIITDYNWHVACGVLGVVGLVWAGLWLLFGAEGRVDAQPGAQRLDDTRVPYLRLLLSRTAIGVYLAGFGAYWVLALNLVWLANYMNADLGLSLGTAAWVIALPSVMQIVLAPSLAYASNVLTRRGMSTRLSRGLMGAGCVIVAGLAMILMSFLGLGAVKIVLIGLSFSIGSVIFTLGSTLIGEISPPTQRGAALGVTNSVQTLAGLVAPTVMGWIVDVGADPRHGFRTGFVWAGVLVAALGVVAAILINPSRDVARLSRVREPRRLPTTTLGAAARNLGTPNAG
jgi:MFS family permease